MYAEILGILLFLISKKCIPEPKHCLESLIYGMFISGDYEDYDLKIVNRRKRTDCCVVLGYNVCIFRP